MPEARLRVLVADDEPDVRLLLTLQLQSVGGFDVVGEACDGQEVLELVGAVRPDVVVLDLLMPRISGLEAMQKLRDGWPGVAVVAYTAVAGETVRALTEKLRIPLVLKTGYVEPLVAAMREAVRALREGRGGR
jgi:CheY-like chemotaxis protein